MRHRIQPRRVSLLATLLSTACAAGCSKPAPAPPSPVGVATPLASVATTKTATPLTAASVVASAPPAADAATDATEGTDAGTLPASLAGKVVLHCGDSMVGGAAGLTRALEAKFKAEGVKRFASDSWISASIITFDQQTRFRDLLTRTRPDIVLITLGANDVFVPHPETLIPFIKGIIKKIGTRECMWISPPTWKPDTGIVEMIKANSAPCTFFDSRNMTIPRGGDHIHPTDKGGAEWAEKVWAQYRTSSAVAATLRPAP